MYDREQVVWIADSIKALLIGTNGTDLFPEDFYKTLKEMVGWKHE